MKQVATRKAIVDLREEVIAGILSYEIKSIKKGTN